MDRTLKNNAHLIIDARKRKNLTRLQSILLFKDSSVGLVLSRTIHEISKETKPVSR